MQQDLLILLKEKGFDIIPDFSGEYRRFNRQGTGNGWSVGLEFAVGNSKFLVFKFGDFKTDEHYTWESGAPVGDFEISKFEAARWVMDEKLKVERLEQYKKSRGEILSLLETALPYGEHPYLIEKSVQGNGLYGAKLSREGRYLYIPLEDALGEVWGLQTIDEVGTKIFYEGAKLRGLFHRIKGKQTGKVYICEGFATGISIYEALGGEHDVLCAMNCGNISAVLESLPLTEDETILCADNDAWTDGNPGVTACQKAIDKAGRGKLVIPVFSNIDTSPTDFNDLHVLEGLTRVREILTGEASGLVANVLKKKKISEHQVVEILLNDFEGDLISCHRDFFVYKDTHWKMLSEAEVSAMKVRIGKISGFSYESRQIESALKYLGMRTDVEAGKLHVPNPYRANFLNGTLRAIPKNDSGIRLEFGPHKKDEFVTNVIPLDYTETVSKSIEFEETLARVFRDEEDRDEKILAVSEMFGASLMPIYPHFFMLHGPGGSGKSTLMILIYNLIGRDNISAVEPHEFKGFTMESMIGKLVNLVTDIDTTQVMADGNLKKIEDRVLMRIDRKFKLPIHAPLPAVHIFGANELPRTFSGSSRAHERRWTFIELSKFQARPGEYRRDYVSWLWERGQVGILQFALEGLRRVISNEGHYTTPKSGKETMEKWQKELDPIAMFIDDLAQVSVQKDLGISLNDAGRVERGKVWEAFRKWSENSTPSGRRFGKHGFYGEMRRKNFVEKVIKGDVYFAGLQIDDADGHEF